MTDPCDNNNGDCSETCNSDPVTLDVTCSCKEGFVLALDNQTCVDSREMCEDPIRQRYDVKTRKCVGRCAAMCFPCCMTFHDRCHLIGCCVTHFQTNVTNAAVSTDAK